ACPSELGHRRLLMPPPRQGTERTSPPGHVHSLARSMAAAADRIAGAMELEGDEARRAWERVAEVMAFRGVDPNWRTRPSVLDELRGWTIKPAPSRGGGRKKAHATN